jgi:hypothetical protein
LSNRPGIMTMIPHNFPCDHDHAPIEGTWGGQIVSSWAEEYPSSWHLVWSGPGFPEAGAAHRLPISACASKPLLGPLQSWTRAL